MSKIITLQHGSLKAEVNPENGQLVSFSSNGIEYFHDGGKPSFEGSGWRNSEVVPYPLFGPADKQEVKVGEKVFSLEQHGISRHTKENSFLLINQENNNILTLIQSYDGRDINNPKYKHGNGHPEYMNWLPYTLEKTFKLTDEGIVCQLKLTNNSDVVMPYMIGWHPAFKVLGSVDEGEFLNNNGMCIATLEEVISQSIIPPEEALTLKGINSVTYRNKNNGEGVRVSSNDFSNNIMLWSPDYDAGMICIEHTSQLPVYYGQKYFEEPAKFESLAPGENKRYSIMIHPLK